MKIINRLVFLLSILGIFISLYLLERYITGGHVACGPVSVGFECDTVKNSMYSLFLGIPLPAYGLVFYFTIFFLSFIKTIIISHQKLIDSFLLFFSFFGVLVSVYLLYLELFVIFAVCLWCTISGIISGAIFLLCLKSLNIFGTSSKA